MKYDLFIDAGAFVGRYVPRDDHHEEACTLWEKAKEECLFSLTTNFIIEEFVTMMVYRFGAKTACQAANEIYQSHTIRVLSATRDLELKALNWIERFSDQKFSMTDAVSFAVMEEQKIKLAFTFDAHFEIAGFQQLRQG